jgi:hypothetical protein
MSSITRKNPQPVTPAGTSKEPSAAARDETKEHPKTPRQPVEIGGRAGPEPTRFGDWEKNGRCIDF